ncbi:MAG: urea ABC transporter permease subunit UrtB [Proteobacteria bacterium]|nr:urea ABC transporter permease subunit UrtB [Pseudomonadota bacterium]
MITYLGRLRAFLVLSMLLTGFGGLPSQAADDATLNKAVAGLAAKGFDDKISAIEALGASGDKRAGPVLEAMVEGNLYTVKSDDSVVIGELKGKVYVLRAPLTLEPVAEVSPQDITKIRVNNRLRGIIRGALGGLVLLSDDPVARRQAADDVFKARTMEMGPMLEKALARENDAAVRTAMERALAAVNLTHATDSALRIEAVKTLALDAGPDTRALLSQIAAVDGDGKPVEADAAVREAVVEALDELESRLAFLHSVENVFQGISLGSVLLLAAVGLAITFGVMGVINMAHGELVMLGAYTTFAVQEVFRNSFPGAFDYSLLVAVPAAFLVSGLAGIAIERGIIRFLYGRPLETLLATWGLSLILQQVVRTIFGPTNQEVGNPSWMSGSVEITSGLLLTYNRIWIIVFSLAVLALILLLLKRTTFGLRMRAVTQNREMAASMGIRTGMTDALTFGLGSGIAGMAGVALSQIDNVSPNLGQAYIIDSFMVVVFGGVGNLWGTLVGAFTLGIVNKLLEPEVGAVLAKILVLVAIILFIQKRPRGLFALRGRSIES